MREDLKEKINEMEKRIKKLFQIFNLSKKKEMLKKMEDEISSSDFWQKKENIEIFQKKYAKLKEQINEIQSLEKEIKDLKELVSLLKEEEEKEIIEKINLLEKSIQSFEKKLFLSGKYDDCFAYLFLQAGAGGRDAEDWAALLLRMYEKFCQKHNFKYEILSRTFTEGGGPEGRIGLRDALMEIKKRGAYGLLKKESGVHRLVRISPFSAKGLRHTSFCKVEVTPVIEKECDIKIDPDDLKIETFRASGPGGQYVNKRASAVRITHLPTGIQVACQTERLQGLNRKKAMEMLISKLVAKKEMEREKELQKIKGKKVSAEFGNQIRSYILHPYKLVKDHRTGVETSDVEGVLDGELDQFIEEEIKIHGK